ncbi:TetR family transcriptional regulator [Isoalcanivorax beigongshangi]|uniref:TetR family transcriptional regulator n=1 Tax=Isoalcanivorax beigongshangi TaxID=3238810 RepID=A0ABV4AIC3_9GAMM
MSTTAEARRDPRRGRTRRALMDAALELVAQKESFSSLSLRLVARKAGVVPTAFYRHFPDMDALGLALVDESFRTLRQVMRDVRSTREPLPDLLQASVDAYMRHVLEQAPHFHFVAKERFSGTPPIRSAIRQEVRLFTSELATDLSRFPLLAKVSAEDLQMMAALLVNNMSAITEQILELPDQHPDEAAYLQRITVKQLRLILLGASAWRSRPR